MATKTLHKLLYSLMILAIFTLAFLAWPQAIYIDNGHAGVLWKRFGGGTQLEEHYLGGEHRIMPWNKMSIYNLRPGTLQFDVSALDKRGAIINSRAITAFQPIEAELPHLHKEIGPEYVARVLIPEIKSCARTMISQHEAGELCLLIASGQLPALHEYDQCNLVQELQDHYIYLQAAHLMYINTKQLSCARQG